MDFSAIKDNLENLDYKVTCFETAKGAADYIKKEVAGKTVGIGGSMTAKEMGLNEILREDSHVYWHWFPQDGMSVDEVRDKAMNTEVYISSVNGIAQTGEIINIDGTCNRLASVFYGHKKVYLLVSVNKIEDDFEKAMHRARNVAAPLNAKRLSRNTPCAEKADKCYDCESPDRICKGVSILWQKPSSAEFEVILINENMGY